jgi:hypothetical protein
VFEPEVDGGAGRRHGSMTGTVPTATADPG